MYIIDIIENPARKKTYLRSIWKFSIDIHSEISRVFFQKIFHGFLQKLLDNFFHNSSGVCIRNSFSDFFVNCSTDSFKKPSIDFLGYFSIDSFREFLRFVFRNSTSVFFRKSEFKKTVRNVSKVSFKKSSHRSNYSFKSSSYVANDSFRNFARDSSGNPQRNVFMYLLEIPPKIFGYTFYIGMKNSFSDLVPSPLKLQVPSLLICQASFDSSGGEFPMVENRNSRNYSAIFSQNLFESSSPLGFL